MISLFVAVILTSCWKSFLLHVKNKKAIQIINSNNSNISMEQIQGLVNSKQ